MKKYALTALLVAAILLPATGLARKTTYIVTNKRLNYVKLVEVKASVAEEHNMSHPVDIPTSKMRDILEALTLSKEHLIGEKVDTRQVFDERAVGYLAPALSRAFREAKPNEEVQFSYVVKSPYFIIRNDRLTMIDAWVSGNELFLDFKKLYAKLSGDTDKRGNMSKIVSRAKGLRVSLDLQPGQQMASVGSRTLVVDLNYVPVVASTAETSSDGVKRTSKSKRTVDDDAAASSKEAAAVDAAVDSDPATRRLEKLDALRKRGLITKKEYKAKKKEILNDL
jgi:hypothetical protein